MTTVTKRKGSVNDASVTPDVVEVLVADAMPLVADALAEALDKFADLSALEVRPSSGLEAVEVALQRKPDVALVDYWMPEMEEAAAARLIVARNPEIEVTVLSWFHGVRGIQNSLDAGAAGFFPKPLSVAQVAEGIRRADAGESPVLLNELETVFKNITRRGSYAAEAWKRLCLGGKPQSSSRLLLGSQQESGTCLPAAAHRCV